MAIETLRTQDKVQVKPRIIEKVPKKKTPAKEPQRSTKEKATDQIQSDDMQINNLKFDEPMMDMMIISQNEEFCIFEQAKAPEKTNKKRFSRLTKSID